MLKDFDFDLPQALIAQHPLDRGKSRLLHRSADGKLDDMEFCQIYDLLEPGDVLVLNNTRVIPSCLQGYVNGVKLKINLINRVNGCDGEQWEFLSQPRKKIKLGSIVQFSHQLVGVVIKKFNQNALDVMEFFICPIMKNTLSNSDILDRHRELSDEQSSDNVIGYPKKNTIQPEDYITQNISNNAINNINHQSQLGAITDIYNQINSEDIQSLIDSDNQIKTKPEDYITQNISNNAINNTNHQSQLGVITDIDNQFIPISKIDFFSLLHQIGAMPLPPYMKRDASEDDQYSYQTVFAQSEGSVAAPTAGLHFSHELLDAVQSKGVKIAYITLHIGGGTFLPVRVDDISNHKMHSELYSIESSTCDLINHAKLHNHRVIAVGTTVTRTLESAALFCGNQLLSPHTRYTDIFIRENYEFKVVDCLVTNFHLPKSTLFILVCAFIDSIVEGKKLYQHAIDAHYRFFSYGDACFLTR